VRGNWLFNADLADAQPAQLVRARANATARRLARASLLLRRKRDGRYLAILQAAESGAYLLRPLDPDCARRSAGLEQLLACLGLHSRAPLHPRKPVRLRPLPRQHTALPALPPPLLGLLDQLAALGIDALDYAQRSNLPLMPEPPRLRHAGMDGYGRPLWLLPGCSECWQRMRDAARSDGIRLHAISGFRGFDYQRGIVERKLARGQSITRILQVNAAPGFSEHHTGRAIDIGSPGEPAAEESFELTAAFAWLCQNAGAFGFRLSYPRNNPHGIAYEPWHWFWTG
jgi:D-alanyl-D-alanine carboxypeptidase